MPSRACSSRSGAGCCAQAAKGAASRMAERSKRGRATVSPYGNVSIYAERLAPGQRNVNPCFQEQGWGSMHVKSHVGFCSEMNFSAVEIAQLQDRYTALWHEQDAVMPEEDLPADFLKTVVAQHR